MKSFYKKPVSLGEAINKLLKRTGLDKGVKQQRVLMMWEEIVGEKVAENTKPLKIERGNLYIEVTNDSWRYNLNFYSGEIIKKLNEAMGSEIVKKLTMK